MTVPDTPIATNFHKALDIKVDLSSEFSLNLILPVNDLPNLINFLLSKIISLNFGVDTGLS